MSIVNYIKAIPDVNCPTCGVKMSHFQAYLTEDSEQMFDFWECHSFTGFCEEGDCNTTLEFTRILTPCMIEDYKIDRLIPDPPFWTECKMAEIGRKLN